MFEDPKKFKNPNKNSKMFQKSPQYLERNIIIFVFKQLYHLCMLHENVLRKHQ